MTLKHAGLFYGPQYNTPGFGGDGVGPTYSNWDRESVTICNCDPGYFGADCSKSKQHIEARIL